MSKKLNVEKMRNSFLALTQIGVEDFIALCKNTGYDALDALEIFGIDPSILDGKPLNRLEQVGLSLTYSLLVLEMIQEQQENNDEEINEITTKAMDDLISSFEGFLDDNEEDED